MDVGERMLPRPSFIAVLALMTGMAAVHTFSIKTPWIASVPVALAFLFFLSRHLRFPAVVAGFAALGMLLQVPQERSRSDSAAILAELDRIDGSLIEVRGRIDGIPRVTDKGASVLIAPGSRLGKSGNVWRFPGAIRIRLGQDSPDLDQFRSAIDGDSIGVIGHVTPLSKSPEPGSFGNYLSSLGVAASLRAVHWELSSSPRTFFARYRAKMHSLANRSEDILRDNLDRDHAALLSAMMLGRTGWLSTAQRESFTRAGLMHLFAVSGLHAGIVGIMLALVSAMIGAGPRGRAILVIGGLFLFCTLTGFRASALRASMLVAVFVMQPLLRREVDRLGALSTVALLLLIAQPGVLWQLGFQLSFLCAATLVLVTPGAVAIEEHLGRRLPRGSWHLQPLIRIVQLMFVTTCIQLALMPFLAAHFREISLISPVANAAILPALPFILGSAILCTAIEVLAPGPAQSLYGLLDVALLMVDEVARRLASLPGASIGGSPWPPWMTGAWYLCLLGGTWSRLRPRFTPFDGVWSALRGVFAALLVALSGHALHHPGDMLLVECLDVGQGDAILVRNESTTLLIDTGPPEGARLLQHLRTRGVGHVDLLVLTHADADHIGGADRLLEEISVGQLLVGGSLAGTDVWQAVAEEVAWQKTLVSTIRRGAVIDVGEDMRIDVLHPASEFTEEGDDRNDASVVLRIAKEEVVFLFTGDAEFDAEENMIFSVRPELLDCTVLKAGHHGSSGSTGAAFLAASSPDHVVFSCGRNNRYGHPAPAVLKRVSAASASVWRTDHQGTVSFETDGRELFVRTER